MRILLVTGMYPSRTRPDFGVFVAGMADGLRERGHTVELAALRDDRSGALRTPAKYALLTARALGVAASRPDVVYAHFLVPPGLIGALAATAARVPLVVTAHGTDVANAARSPLVRALTRIVLRRAAAVVAVSGYLAERLPDGARRVEVIDCGVDTSRFTPAPRAAGVGPRFLFVGSLTPRKNAGRLLEAFAAVGSGTLTVIGDGPEAAKLRAAAPPGVRFLGRQRPARVVEELALADVLVAPSLVEAQGQQVLEALASGRPVVATRVGGPAEVVDSACGVLVEPTDVVAIADGMRRAAALPVPCEAGVRVAATHARERQVERVDALLREVVGDR